MRVKWKAECKKKARNLKKFRAFLKSVQKLFEKKKEAKKKFHATKFMHFSFSKVALFVLANIYTWVKLEGMYYGFEYINAFGYYDPQNKCIRIPANIPDRDKIFYFTDDPYQTNYYAAFVPCDLEDSWEWFYSLDNDDDEMWLRVQPNGQLKLGASNYPSQSENRYANSYTFYYYYASSGAAPDDNYFSLIMDATFTRTSSYIPSHKASSIRKIYRPKSLIHNKQ